MAARKPRHGWVPRRGGVWAECVIAHTLGWRGNKCRIDGNKCRIGGNKCRIAEVNGGGRWRAKHRVHVAAHAACDVPALPNPT
jgi:hypothetical protein